MPYGIVPRGLPRSAQPFRQTPQRAGFRRGEVANAMLEVDRQRLARFARGGRGTRRSVEQAAPAVGGSFVLAHPSQEHRQHPERVNSHQRH